jgi:hypothetical protein
MMADGEKGQQKAMEARKKVMTRKKGDRNGNGDQFTTNSQKTKNKKQKTKNKKQKQKGRRRACLAFRSVGPALACRPPLMEEGQMPPL